MIPFLAQAPQAPGTSYLIIGIVVVALTAIANLALITKQLFGGNKGDRKIEPTELHAITTELREQTKTLNKLDREMGGMSATIEAVDAKIDAQGAQVENAFRRINAISMESAAVTARVEGLERREDKRNA